MTTPGGTLATSRIVYVMPISPATGRVASAAVIAAGSAVFSDRSVQLLEHALETSSRYCDMPTVRSSSYAAPAAYVWAARPLVVTVKTSWSPASRTGMLDGLTELVTVSTGSITVRVSVRVLLAVPAPALVAKLGVTVVVRAVGIVPDSGTTKERRSTKESAEPGDERLEVPTAPKTTTTEVVPRPLIVGESRSAKFRLAPMSPIETAASSAAESSPMSTRNSLTSLGR